MASIEGMTDTTPPSSPSKNGGSIFSKVWAWIKAHKIITAVIVVAVLVIGSAGGQGADDKKDDTKPKTTAKSDKTVTESKETTTSTELSDAEALDRANAETISRCTKVTDLATISANPNSFGGFECAQLAVSVTVRNPDLPCEFWGTFDIGNGPSVESQFWGNNAAEDCPDIAGITPGDTVDMLALINGTTGLASDGTGGHNSPTFQVLRIDSAS